MQKILAHWRSFYVWSDVIHLSFFIEFSNFGDFIAIQFISKPEGNNLFHLIWGNFFCVTENLSELSWNHLLYKWIIDLAIVSYYNFWSFNEDTFDDEEHVMHHLSKIYGASSGYFLFCFFHKFRGWLVSIVHAESASGKSSMIHIAIEIIHIFHHFWSHSFFFVMLHHHFSLSFSISIDLLKISSHPTDLVADFIELAF